MRGGVLEATLHFDDLTTEVIADGKHLDASLLRLAYKIKGGNRLALVTDCSRAITSSKEVTFSLIAASPDAGEKQSLSIPIIPRPPPGCKHQDGPGDGQGPSRRGPRPRATARRGKPG